MQDPLDVWLYFFRYAEELDSEQLPSALDMAEIHQAMEELKVLSQNDLERERYLARVKLQRDELSRLYSAREEGREEGWGKGREEGYRAGSLEEVRKTLFRLGRKRLGEPPAATVTGLEAIDDLERLEQLSERLLDVGMGGIPAPLIKCWTERGYGCPEPRRPTWGAAGANLLTAGACSRHVSPVLS